MILSFHKRPWKYIRLKRCAKFSKAVSASSYYKWKKTGLFVKDKTSDFNKEGIYIFCETAIWSPRITLESSDVGYGISE